MYINLSVIVLSLRSLMCVCVCMREGKGSKGKVREFQCTPAKYKMLVDAGNEELADDDSGDSEIEQQVIDLGLAGRR